jgi:hypothetical protein
MNRRSFMTGLLIAAPAVIKTPSLLMPVKALKPARDDSLLEPTGFIKWADMSDGGEFVNGSTVVYDGKLWRIKTFDFYEIG